MNAAFPLVSPATSLPTEPPRRIVNAGYFDNYGVTIAHAWLTKNREWLAENTSDVVLIQIRAYPIAPATGGGDGLQAIRESWDWLTTPVEGYTAANKRAMIARNQDKIDALAQWFGDRRSSAKAPTTNFHSFVLECPESAPLSWYLARKDLHLLRFRCHDWDNSPRDFKEITSVLGSDGGSKL